MNKELVAEASIEINASPAAIWNVLTDPVIIKEWLFGTNADTDWKVGSTIAFTGEYDGHIYHDKGNVLECVENELLKYNYWAQYSGLEDAPENYASVTYRIRALEGKTELTWIQQGFANEKGQQHTQQGLPAMLLAIKELSE